MLQTGKKTRDNVVSPLNEDETCNYAQFARHREVGRLLDEIERLMGQAARPRAAG